MGPNATEDYLSDLFQLSVCPLGSFTGRHIIVHGYGWRRGRPVPTIAGFPANNYGSGSRGGHAKEDKVSEVGQVNSITQS